MSALWAEVPLEGPVGGVQHVSVPVSLVTVTPQQAFLGLGA